MKKNDKHRTISQHSQLIHKRDLLKLELIAIGTRVCIGVIVLRIHRCISIDIVSECKCQPPPLARV